MEGRTKICRSEKRENLNQKEMLIEMLDVSGNLDVYLHAE